MHLRCALSSTNSCWRVSGQKYTFESRNKICTLLQFKFAAVLASLFIWNNKHYWRFIRSIFLNISIQICFTWVTEKDLHLLYTNILSSWLWIMEIKFFLTVVQTREVSHSIGFLHIYAWHIKILNSICMPILYWRIYRSLQICVLLLCIVVKDVVRGHWSCCPSSMCSASHLCGFPSNMHRKSNVIKCIELNEGGGNNRTMAKYICDLAVVKNMSYEKNWRCISS